MALDVFDVSVNIKLNDTAVRAVEALSKQFTDLEKLIKDVATAAKDFSAVIKNIGLSGRDLEVVARNIQDVSKLSGSAVTRMEGFASATESAASASRALGRSMEVNAKLAGESAAAMKAASRSSAAAASAAGGSGRHGRGLSSHGLMEAGIGFQMAGAPMLHLGNQAFEQAMDTAHQIQMLKADTRVTPAMVQQAVDAAVAATRSSPGTTVESNLKTVLDVKNITGRLDEAIKTLPIFANMVNTLQAIGARQGLEGAEKQAYAAAKAEEIFGHLTKETVDPRTGAVTRELDPEGLGDRIAKITRVAAAENMRVDPNMYLGLAKQGRVAGMALSDDFLYEKAPALMNVLGGQRTGTALMSMFQVFGATMTDKNYNRLVDLHLADQPTFSRERDPRTGKMKRVMHRGGIYAQNEMMIDPTIGEQMWEKRLADQGIRDPREQILKLFPALQRATVQGFIADLIKDRLAIEKTQENIRNTNPQTVLQDPHMAVERLGAAWKNLMTAIGSPALGDMVKFLDSVTADLNKIEDLVRAHPDAARNLLKAAEVAGAVLVGAGGLTMALWALSGPAKMAKAAIDSVGAAFGGIRTTPAVPGSAGGPGRTGRGLVAIGGIAGIVALGLELGNLAHDADEAVPALRKLDDAMRDWLRGMLSQSVGAFKNFGKEFQGPPSNDLGLPGLPSDLGAGAGATTNARSTVRLNAPGGNPLHIGLAPASAGWGSSLERMLGFGGQGPTGAATITGSALSGMEGRALTEMGGAIGDKSAQAVKDKLDPHVIGTEIGNIAASTIRASISGLTINVDGQQFGRVVDRSRDQQAQRPPTGPSLPDVRLGPLFPAHAS